MAAVRHLRRGHLGADVSKVPSPRSTLLAYRWRFLARLAGIMQDRLEKQSELWVPFTMEAFTSEIADGKTVIIDFTADWCLVCKTLEATVLETEAVEAAVIMNNIATFKADWTHGEPEVTRMLENLGAKQVPVVAVFPARDPMRPIVLRGGFTTTTILNAIDKAVSEPAEKESTHP